MSSLSIQDFLLIRAYPTRSDLPEQIGYLQLADERGACHLKHGPFVIGAGAAKKIPRRHPTPEKSEREIGYFAAPQEDRIIS
ncbi:hypothetical protein QUC32_11720 [Novosphingobium resinovorum]|uniref:hypothetical protein n=1 Tax=Novosphingobium TaxID=165696 RepID=UPI001B3C6AAB|nr:MULTISPECIES: hypothetical protein [Novosphingobium]MBF7010340.1 hypothetical protein [Novosphingobium sp. HR1a]WJM28345.1 hypothetical protein QUC32_11720 [Novosphingobium resinovorum]